MEMSFPETGHWKRDHIGGGKIEFGVAYIDI